MSLNKLQPGHSNGPYKQNYYKPKFPSKCINVQAGTALIYRSSYELRMFAWCDENVNVSRWGCEILEIPYVYEGGTKVHRYYPDIYFEVVNKAGKLEKHVVEIKPKAQTIPPKPPKRKTTKALNNFSRGVNEYNKNVAKWKAAKRYCDQRGMIFSLLTEDTLF